MKSVVTTKTMLVASGFAALLAVPAIAATSLGMLDTIERGSWDVRYRDEGAVRKVCVKSGHEFLQLGHGRDACRRFVVEDGKREVTVQYTCRGNGYGRTNIRRENAKLVQIESQGIANGRPFAFSAEARRTGRCR